MSYPEQITVDKIHGKRDNGHMMKAEFDRDMWRLRELRSKYDNPGLNTYESNEVDGLLEKWDIELGEWTRRDMFK